MQYRIIEISKRPNFDFTVSRTWDDVKKWYVIEYKDDTTANTWKRITYNMEKIMHYGEFGSCHSPTICTQDGAWKIGPYIPTLKMAKQLLNRYLELKKQLEEQNKPDKVVFANYSYTDDSIISECTKLLNEFQDFLALNEKTN